MEHYYTKIHGWFNFQHIYSHAANIFSDGSNFLEIGSWKGTSTVYLGVELINLKKLKTKIHCIDLWDESDEYKNETSIVNKTLYQEFLSNIKPLQDNGLELNIIKNKSQNCFNLFDDNFFDFIYIDGSHLYENVKEDILKYFPKLKTDGLLAGHDWQSEDVVKAVSETLGLDNIKTISNTWIYSPKGK